jgi:hypothetical protein
MRSKLILKSCTSNFFLSIYLYIRYVWFRKLNKKKINKNELKLKYLEIIKKDLKVKNDWFSHNIPNLDFFFKKDELYKKEVNALEIGSYEGNSSFFFLKYFDNLKLTCVDTFKGSDEHTNKNFNIIFENFKFNTSSFTERIKVFRESSDSFFSKKNDEMYDLIYIDGSHYCDDVLNDANNSFKYLNKNGYIIFDDFLWNYYPDINDNPIGAIKKFLKKNFFNLKISSIGYQIIFKKIN